MIKLTDILKKVNKKIMEDVHADQQPVVKFSMPQATQVSKSDIPSGGNKPFVSKEKDLSKKVADLSDSKIVDSAANIISSFENSMSNKRGGFNKSTGKWLPHDSVEGGMPTIAYGHKITSNSELANYKNNGLTDGEAKELLKKDIGSKMADARRLIKDFDKLPAQVRIAALNGLYRGDLGPKTIQFLSARNFKQAAREYLNHKEYKTTSNKGVKKRMDWNAAIFKNAS
jgi:hypothetical protein